MFVVESATQILTSHILRRYACCVANEQKEKSIELENAISAQSNSNTKILQESESSTHALAPLEILYGKTFLSAIAIVMHNTEIITHVVEVTHNGEVTGREFYQIGEHTLFSPYYCPCAAYALQSIRRQETWCCKHLLALQIVMALLDAGVHINSVHNNEVNTNVYQDMLITSLAEGAK